MILLFASRLFRNGIMLFLITIASVIKWEKVVILYMLYDFIYYIFCVIRWRSKILPTDLSWLALNNSYTVKSDINVHNTRINIWLSLLYVIYLYCQDCKRCEYTNFGLVKWCVLIKSQISKNRTKLGKFLEIESVNIFSWFKWLLDLVYHITIWPKGVYKL